MLREIELTDSRTPGDPREAMNAFSKSCAFCILKEDWFKTERISILGGSLVLIDGSEEVLDITYRGDAGDKAWRHASPPEVALNPNSILYSIIVTTQRRYFHKTF